MGLVRQVRHDGRSRDPDNQRIRLWDPWKMQTIPQKKDSGERAHALHDMFNFSTLWQRTRPRIINLRIACYASGALHQRNSLSLFCCCTLWTQSDHLMHEPSIRERVSKDVQPDSGSLVSTSTATNAGRAAPWTSVPSSEGACAAPTGTDGSSIFTQRKQSQLDVTYLLAAQAKPGQPHEVAGVPEPEFDVLTRFRSELARETPAAPAAVHVLTDLIRCSRSETIHGLELEVRRACDKMISYARSSELSVRAACELFVKFITRTSFDFPDFAECKMRLIQRGEHFRAMTDTCRERIAVFGEPFILQGSNILTHGGSRVVFSIIERAARMKRKQFRVVVVEGRGRHDAALSSGMTAKTLRFCCDVMRLGIQVTIIPDSAVPAAMEVIDIVLLGAEAIAESGAVINQVGSLGIALAAKTFNVQVFIAAESYKFVRIYPLTQRDISKTDSDHAPRSYRQMTRHEEIPKQLQFECPPSDLTPGSYIHLLITDLGVLTPAAVSEALMKMYH